MIDLFVNCIEFQIHTSSRILSQYETFFKYFVLIEIERFLFKTFRIFLCTNWVIRIIKWITICLINVTLIIEKCCYDRNRSFLTSLFRN